ncbi:MAG TPA: hypothetical protein VF532_04540 [Candidatus Angelobacter sp.]
MNNRLAIALCLLACGLAPWRAGAQTQGPGQRQQVQPDLNLIIEQVQKVALATNGDIGKLRIEKWKTDADQKAQLQKVADSLQRNITNAVPGLISDVQNTHGSVSSAFKLYHNLNVVYEFLSSLADAAGSLGKKEEYDPLAADAAALDSVRSNLSQYIEQAAEAYEARVRATAPDPMAEPAPPTKIIVEGEDPKKTSPAKKKTATPAQKPTPKATPKPTPKPSPSPSGTGQ